jgi:hypothetical protein
VKKFSEYVEEEENMKKTEKKLLEELERYNSIEFEVWYQTKMKTSQIHGASYLKAAQKLEHLGLIKLYKKIEKVEPANRENTASRHITIYRYVKNK